MMQGKEQRNTLNS